MGKYFGRFDTAIDYSIEQLKSYGGDVDTGRWQGVTTAGKPDLVTREILNLQFEVPLEQASWYDNDEEDWITTMAEEIEPNLPWADEHFAERVGGRPLNPDPSHERWPWWRGQYDKTTFPRPRSQSEADAMRAGEVEGTRIFTHTYSERFWPAVVTSDEGTSHYRRGIHFRYGDYNDVLNLLAEDPYTRQAYLPIFFPEDTGAVHRGRIPCSLGYHFLLRGGKLHCWYEIRSCDAVRHFRDDLYLAARLVVHTIELLADRELRSDREQVWNTVDPGTLFFTAHSFHVHMGDYHRL